MKINPTLRQRKQETLESIAKNGYSKVHSKPTVTEHIEQLKRLRRDENGQSHPGQREYRRESLGGRLAIGVVGTLALVGVAKVSPIGDGDRDPVVRSVSNDIANTPGAQEAHDRWVNDLPESPADMVMMNPLDQEQGPDYTRKGPSPDGN